MDICISNNCNIPRNEFLKAIRFILNSMVFTFNNMYEQTFGTPMGSSLSPIADIVTQDLENAALKSLKFIPSFYVRYVDDVIIAVPGDEIYYTIDTFNSYHPRIQFSVEVESENVLNFLDIKIIVENLRNFSAPYVV